MTDIQFVDEHDEVIGAGSIMEALTAGYVHRVIRAFVTNRNGDVLLQRRAMGIYSFPGKWDNSVGGHVDEGESYDVAVAREALEEMKIEGVEFRQVSKYYTELPKDPNLSEKRFTMLYSAVYDGDIVVNPEEVMDYKWIAPQEVTDWMERAPEEFTPGSMYAFKKFREATATRS